MTTKLLSPRARMKELRAKLRYRQTMNRYDAATLRGGIQAAQRIAAAMRELQKEMRKP